MRHLSSKFFAMALLGLLLPGIATAQQKKRPSRGGQLGTNFARGPKVGEKLPDISAFDADGKPFKLSSLKGSHAVLVFGCLT